jgi:two-component system NarL family sensor kinase
LSRIHAHLDHGDSTYWYHARYSELRDSVFTADMGARLAEMETRFDTERKEREIQLQRADLVARDLEIVQLGRKADQRRFWLVVAVGGIGLLLVSGLLLMQVQRRRANAVRNAALLAERERGLKAVVAGTDAERERIARELHDGIGQQITGLRFRLEDLAGRVSGVDHDAGDRVREALAITEDAGRDVRELAHGMMPRSLGTLGLAPALQDMLSKAFGRTGIRWSFDHLGVEGRLGPEREVGVYRIAQELTGNVLKHAGAREVQVQLLRNKGHLVLMVTDDGGGFDPARVPGDGMGLTGMRDRARLLGGTLQFESVMGHGTTVTLRIPVDGSPLPA